MHRLRRQLIRRITREIAIALVLSCDPAIGNVTSVIKRRSLNSIIIIPRSIFAFLPPLLGPFFSSGSPVATARVPQS